MDVLYVDMLCQTGTAVKIHVVNERYGISPRAHQLRTFQDRVGNASKREEGMARNVRLRICLIPVENPILSSEMMCAHEAPKTKSIIGNLITQVKE